MSIGEIEEKFNYAQLMIMLRIQAVSYEDSNPRIKNKGSSKEEINKNAWRFL